MPVKNPFKLTVDVVCLFPQSLQPFFSSGLLGRAQGKKLISLKAHDLRDWAGDRRRSVDAKPYGGGPGMVLTVPPLAAARQSLSRGAKPKPYIILTSASGKRFNQARAEKLSKKKHLIIFCGRYEGVDERFSNFYVDEELSIGDYVLSGGEVAAAVLIEALARLVPGVVGNQDSLASESFRAQSLLDYPQYTRPETYEGRSVPEVLLSGNHQKIEAWRRKKSLEKTRKVRPDLLRKTLNAGRDRSNRPGRSKKKSGRIDSISAEGVALAHTRRDGLRFVNP